MRSNSHAQSNAEFARSGNTGSCVCFSTVCIKTVSVLRYARRRQPLFALHFLLRSLGRGMPFRSNWFQRDCGDASRTCSSVVVTVDFDRDAEDASIRCELLSCVLISPMAIEIYRFSVRDRVSRLSPHCEKMFMPSMWALLAALLAILVGRAESQSCAAGYYAVGSYCTICPPGLCSVFAAVEPSW